jgi:hypothetical protein
MSREYTGTISTVRLKPDTTSPTNGAGHHIFDHEDLRVG